MPSSRHVRVRTGSTEAVCIVCGRATAHDLVVSGIPGLVRRGTPRHDLRHYTLCRTCGTKVPQPR